jgi:hypothetical protein
VIRDTVNTFQVAVKMIPASESPVAVIDVTMVIFTELVFGFLVPFETRTQSKGFDIAIGTPIFAFMHSLEVFST